MAKRFEFAEQYNIVCVVIHPGDTADEVIRLATENDATYFEGDDVCYCVRFHDRPQELFTAEALKRSRWDG